MNGGPRAAMVIVFIIEHHLRAHLALQPALQIAQQTIQLLRVLREQWPDEVDGQPRQLAFLPIDHESVRAVCVR